jgi:flagellar hook assembly protein FlgD
VDGSIAAKVSGDSLDILPNGPHTVRVEAADSAGNVGFAEVNFTVDTPTSLTLSNVGISSNTIDTAASGSSTIFFTIDAPATVTLKIVPEQQGPAGTPVYQASQDCSVAGAYLFTWEGKTTAGTVVPDEAYLAILEASNGVSNYIYSPVQPTGTGTVNCSQSESFDPLSNQPMTVTYTPGQPSRVDISISWGSLNFKILDAFPATPGNYSYDWDGRNPSGTLLDIGAQSSCSVASLLRENYIITTGDTPRASDLKTDPYMMHFAYGQFTRIKYTLSKDANVTVKLISPSGTIITLANGQLQSTGPHEIEWNGTDASDATGKKALAAEEGDYLVSVQAVNPVTGTSSTTRGNVRIKY